MGTKWYKNQQLILSILEIIINVAIGLFFYIFLSMQTVGIIIWFVGILLVLDRIIINHINQENYDKLELRIDKIGQVIDLNEEYKEGIISKLCQSYSHTSDPEFTNLKNKYINNALIKINKLKDEKSSDELTTSESFDLFLPILQNVQIGESVKAVTFLLQGEWDDSPQVQEYLKSNIDAAQRGASVERIFIMDKSLLNDAIKNEAVKKHTKDQSNETKLKGYFVDRTRLKKEEPELYNASGDGFIIINLKVALIDKMYSEGKYRNIVTLNKNVIKELDETFMRLKRDSIELSSSLVKGFDNPKN